MLSRHDQRFDIECRTIPSACDAMMTLSSESNSEVFISLVIWVKESSGMSLGGHNQSLEKSGRISHHSRLFSRPSESLKREARLCRLPSVVFACRQASVRERSFERIGRMGDVGRRSDMQADEKKINPVEAKMNVYGRRRGVREAT